MVFATVTSNLLCRNTHSSIVRHYCSIRSTAAALLPSSSIHSTTFLHPSRSFSGVDASSSSTDPNKTDTDTSTTVHQPKQPSSSSSSKSTFESRLERGPLPKDNLPYHHFHKQSTTTNTLNNTLNNTKPPKKFESPRKRANKLMRTILQEHISQSKSSNPSVHNTPFRVGDAIELTVVQEGGVNSTQTEQIRGVVLGRTNRGLGSVVFLRDVVMGEAINRTVPLYSPLVKKIERLEENFVFKGRRKVKRAKLYYLNDRKLEETRVTKLR